MPFYVFCLKEVYFMRGTVVLVTCGLLSPPMPVGMTKII